MLYFYCIASLTLNGWKQPMILLWDNFRQNICRCLVIFGICPCSLNGLWTCTPNNFFHFHIMVKIVFWLLKRLTMITSLSKFFLNSLLRTKSPISKDIVKKFHNYMKQFQFKKPKFKRELRN